VVGDGCDHRSGLGGVLLQERVHMTSTVGELVLKRSRARKHAVAPQPDWWPQENQCPRLVAWMRHLLWLIANEYDVVVLFTGDTGKGKSSVIWWLWHVLDKGFHEGRMALKGEHLMRTLPRRKRGDAAALDEGRELADARRSMSLENMALNDFVEICRIQGVILGVAKPFGGDTDKRIRDQFADFWVHVPDRGVAVVSQPVRDSLSKWLKKGPVSMKSDGTSWRRFLAFSFPDPGPWQDWMDYKGRKVQHAKNWRPKDFTNKVKKGRNSVAEDDF
jgi:hypothetical protein